MGTIQIELGKKHELPKHPNDQLHERFGNFCGVEARRPGTDTRNWPGEFCHDCQDRPLVAVNTGQIESEVKLFAMDLEINPDIS